MTWTDTQMCVEEQAVTLTHADARSVFTDLVYGFMAPLLRKSKQETNASNSIPETSGKLKQHFACVFWRKRLRRKAAFT